MGSLILKRILTTLASLIKKYLNTTERILLLAAVVTAGVFGKLYFMERGTREIGEIAARGLPEGVLAQYQVENRRLIQAVKDADGRTRVVIRYIPGEGNVKVVTKERDEAVKKFQALLRQLRSAKTEDEVKKIEEELKEVEKDLEKPPIVIIKDKGLTSRFGGGFIITPGASFKFTSRGRDFSLPIAPALDWKYGYWKRYSALVQISPLFIGPLFTRHIDDTTPRWMHIENLEMGLSAGPLFGRGWPLNSGWQGALTVRSNF